MADFRQRLSLVEEQTKLLLEKQLEAKKYCDNQFSDLLSLIDQKVQETDEQSDEYKSLLRIHDLISKQFSKFSDDVDDDIQFLNEQIKAVRSINEIKDDKKAEELFKSILEEDEELLEMAEFEKKMDQEAVTSKKSFISIMDDIKSSVEEGKFEELEVSLHAMEQDREEGEQADDQDVFEDLEKCDDFDCSSCADESDDDSCNSSCCSSCPSSKSGCGIDLFSGLFDGDDEDKEK